MKCHFETLADVYGKGWAENITRVLDDAGYIIVPKGAIGAAQREAVAQYKEDDHRAIAAQ